MMWHARIGRLTGHAVILTYSRCVILPACFKLAPQSTWRSNDEISFLPGSRRLPRDQKGPSEYARQLVSTFCFHLGKLAKDCRSTKE